MAISKKADIVKPFIQTKSFKKLLMLYGGYCILVLFIHLMLTSVFSFFHFLLDHELTTIENWLSLNGWEIIGASKLMSFAIVMKLIQVNSHFDSSFREEVQRMEMIPSKKAIASIFFLLVMFYSLLIQFGGGIENNQILDELFLSSFLGSVLLYGIDVFLILIISNFFRLKFDHILQAFLLCLCLFLITSKILLPYVGKYAIFLVVHFVSLFYLSRRNNLGDMICYLIIVIAPLSSFLGVDLVWDNSYSMFTLSEELPILGVLLIWTVALGYYHRSKLD